MSAITNGPTPNNFRSFSTDHIPHHERVEYWEAHNADALIGLDIRPLHAQTLEARQQNRLTPTIRAAKVFGSSQLIERSPAVIRKHPTDAVALFFCTHGDSFYTDEFGTHVLQAGELLICNADSSFVRGFGIGVSEMVLTVGMEQFWEISGGASLSSAKKINFGRTHGSQPRIAAATRLAQWVDKTLSNPESPTDFLEQECLSWLATLFQSAGKDSAQLFDQAQHFIDLHLSDPDLRRTDIAHLLHLSERQVARLFTAHDTSFSNEVLRKRIHAAKLLLQAEPQKPVTEIARRCGFRSTSHFSRTFREFVGCSPSESRNHDSLNVTAARIISA